jgi:hypothetical protein
MKFNRPMLALKLAPSMAECTKQLALVGINVIEKLAVFLSNYATSIVNQPGSRAAIAAGYKALQGLVFPTPVPIWAAWRRNDEGESSIAATAIKERSLQATEVLLGDTTFGGPDLVQGYAAAGGFLLTPKQLPKQRRSWKNDLYTYRKETIELLFQRVIQSCDLKACPVKGLNRNGAFVICSVWLYQIIFLSNYRRGKSVAQIKDAIDCARWRLAA